MKIWKLVSWKSWRSLKEWSKSIRVINASIIVASTNTIYTEDHVEENNIGKIIMSTQICSLEV